MQSLVATSSEASAISLHPQCWRAPIVAKPQHENLLSKRNQTSPSSSSGFAIAIYFCTDPSTFRYDLPCAWWVRLFEHPRVHSRERQGLPRPKDIEDQGELVRESNNRAKEESIRLRSHSDDLRAGRRFAIGGPRLSVYRRHRRLRGNTQPVAGCQINARGHLFLRMDFTSITKRQCVQRIARFLRKSGSIASWVLRQDRPRSRLTAALQGRREPDRRDPDGANRTTADPSRLRIGDALRRRDADLPAFLHLDQAPPRPFPMLEPPLSLGRWRAACDRYR
jgi:hypothetical protein